MNTLELNIREYGEQHRGEPPVILLHGLFGSSVNWHGIAKQIAERRWVLVPDLRNHGHSPHADDCSYPALAADVLALMDRLEINSACLVGHSMGGKVAMWLALSASDRIGGMVAVDVAPVRYAHDFNHILEPLLALNLARVDNRQDADAKLARSLEDKELRNYLLQNLIKDGDSWRWRINLEALRAGQGDIADFPNPPEHSQFMGTSLLIAGGSSSYIQPEHEGRIRQLFPYAKLRVIAGAGHWVYAEKPTAFISALEPILRSQVEDNQDLS